MASIPDHFYSSADYCYTFPYDQLSGLPVPSALAAGGGGGGAAMWGPQEDFLVPFCGENMGLVDAATALSTSSPAESFMSSSSSSLPEQLGFSDGVVTAFSDYRSSMMGLHGNGIAGVQNFGGGSYGVNPQNGFEFGEECCATSFLPEFIKPIGFVSGQKNWSNQMHEIEESNIMKVGRYSEEERKERIVRYLKKRNQRNFNKTIKIKYDDEEDWLQDFALCCWVNGGAN
ncbi:hypothetical protein TIFTF001_025638 [Ficus carica]|uniref:Uncharacterized protein n=1 Tax=Ficus carica TaxID=3494 RepID=A0AA88DKL4_FICCA|nr:hypothetical protein TIFTF001_025638 [Ficus carica]